MATLYISEFGDNGVAQRNVQVASKPALTTQTVAISASSAQSAAFSSQTTYIRVHTDVICSTVVGANPTATTAGERLAADNTEYFRVQPGHKIAVIANT